MAQPKAAWGIELGAYAIKAIKLDRNGDDVTVADFAVIPHKKVLTTPDLDQDEMVRLGLGQFISQKTLEGEHLVMSVPGHSAFARFAKLPPVEPKKVPDIVKFEAVQQIPFPIDQVEWDYQTFTSEDSPEIEVGIFAITRERVQQRLNLYGELGVSPESMTLSPVAVYNAMYHDHGLATHRKPIVYIDIGTSATDVVIAEAGRCWIRTFPLGGTHFTEAIASAFKLSYSKAEKLKLEASSSKYAKQIMQAMRPVFSDLLQDLQRSIGYYQSLHRESELNTMVGIGSTFKIPGLRKFLGQQLQIEVARLDEYKKIAVTGREAASFAENAVNMATAYGLALQGVGLAPIAANLVPVKTLRDQMWHAKTKWFAAAAAIIIVGAGLSFYRPIVEGGKLAPTIPNEVATTLDTGKRYNARYEEVKNTSDVGFTAQNMLRLFDDRDVWPHLVNDTAEALKSAKPQADLLGSDPVAIKAIDPKVRTLVQLEKLDGEYVPPSGGAPANPEEGPPMAAKGPPTIAVTLHVQLSHDDPVAFLNETVADWLRENAEPKGDRAAVPYRITNVRIDKEAQQKITVTATGEEKRTTPPAGEPQQPRSGPDRPPRKPPETGGGTRGLGAGPSMPRQNSETVQAPGDKVGLGNTGDSSDNSDPQDDPETDRPGERPLGTPTRPGESPANLLNLEEAAPIEARPSVYPPDSTYFIIPIMFDVELIDPRSPAAAPTEPAVTAAPPVSDDERTAAQEAST